MVNLSAFDAIRDNVFADRYVQVTIHQRQELRNDLANTQIKNW